MIEFNLTPIRELIDFLKYIEEVGKTRKLKNLHKLYFRILCLLREIQDSNLFFLECLQESCKCNSSIFLIDALSTVENIACLTSKILEIEDRPFSDNTISELLFLEDKDLFFKLRKVTGMKGERVRFWKSISGSVLKSANKCKIDMHRNKKRQGPKYKLYNIPSNAYMCNVYAPVEYVDVIINQEFLEKQIGIAKDVIVKFDEMINEYWLFVKKTVTTEEII